MVPRIQHPGEADGQIMRDSRAFCQASADTPHGLLHLIHKAIDRMIILPAGLTAVRPGQDETVRHVGLGHEQFSGCTMDDRPLLQRCDNAG